MPTLRIVYDVDGWAYHNRARALQKYAPSDFEVSIAVQGHRGDFAKAAGDREVDLVFVISLPEMPRAAGILRERGWRSKLVGSWNSSWPRQLPQFYAAYRIADAVIINNTLAWERVGRLRRTQVLPNGVDLEVFRVQVPPAQRKPKVLWVGSEFQRRVKRYDDLILPLQSELEKRGIDCELLLADSYSGSNRSPEEMARWYNSGTVLVCASDTEGTPNPALEAAACGCTVVSTPVGNMPELIRNGVNGYLVEQNLNAIVDGVQAACDEYPALAARMQEDIQAWDWKKRSAPFYDVFRGVLGANGRATEEKPDLSDQVTVFVTTVGAASYDACRTHLDEQDCAFGLRIVDRVAPMNSAFQRMLDECTTPFFVQVDEDMLLYPHAVRRLWQQITAAPPSTAICFAWLHDAHLDRPIVGVKIYRHSIVRDYPFANVQAFEKLQLQQLRADGYAVANLPLDECVLGLHGTHWTPESIYERYATLESRRRLHPREMRWFEEYHAVLLQRFLREPSDLNFYALAGLLSAAFSDAGEAGDKDYRRYLELPGLASARKLFEELRAVPRDPNR